MESIREAQSRMIKLRVDTKAALAEIKRDDLSLRQISDRKIIPAGMWESLGAKKAITQPSWFAHGEREQADGSAQKLHDLIWGKDGD
jgi:hypothetical protein